MIGFELPAAASYFSMSSIALLALSRATLVRSTLIAVVMLVPAPARAQPASSLPVEGTTSSRFRELINNNIWHFVGDVEMESKDSKLYADEVWYYSEDQRALASGNVVFIQGTNRISADRAEMNTETRLGTFFNASGVSTIQPPRTAPVPGAFVAPRLANQENDVYFFGETIEKIGPRKYKITNGGFSTCVQPTPRWHLSASTITLHVDHHTLLRNAIFRVKDVPLMYLPVFYYPTEEDDRSTGFLIPTYGVSNSRGQTIGNEFFWAIDRSQDATLSHEWYSKLGQRVEGEYRYNFGGGSEGYFRSSTLGQDEVPATATPASRSYEVRANAQQLLPLGLRARARVDYYSSFTTMQTFNTNVYDASRTSRTYGGNVVGAWSSYSLNSTFDRSEYFTNATNSVLTGNAPRISVARSERPITRGSPLYVSVNGEYADFVRESRADTVVYDSSLRRVDFLPQVRFPFKRWQWFTVNSTASWRQTMYSRSYSEDPNDIDPVTLRRRIVDDSINRQYFTVAAQTVGPVFTRIWNTPDNGYAERFKHSIEPFFNVQRTSAIDAFDRIVITDGVDYTVGKTTSFAYGLNNRLYAKRRIGQTSQAQEIVSLEIYQSYYSDARSAQYDPNFNTGAGSGSAPSNFSPIGLRMRTTPTPNFNTSFRAEIDSTKYALRTLSVDGSYNWTNRLVSSLGWSRRFFIEGVTGFDNPEALDHSLNLSTNAHTQDNRVGVIYTLNYDVLRSRAYQQRVSGFYNTQCCGVAFEYQRYDYGGGYSYPVDKRFFMTFTLAGLGNFSPFSGGNTGNSR